MRLSRSSQLLLISLVTLLVYYPVMSAGFSPVDDQKMINSLINSPGFSLKGLFFPGGGYYYRPILMLSYFADNMLWDMSTSFMHLENISLHLINSLLVFFLCRKLHDFYNLEPGYGPLIASLMFVLHPINTESVSWISGRTDVLALSFVLLSFLFLVGSVKKQNIFYMFVAVAFFFLGCLAKESALFYYAGAMALIYALHFKGRQTSFLNHAYICLPGWILWSSIAAGYLFFRRFALASADSGISHVVKAVSGNEALGAIPVDHFDQIRIAFKVMGFYLKKMFVPWPLNFAIIEVSDAYVLLGCILLLTIIWLVTKLVRDGSVVAALYLASIGMASSALLVALGNMAWTPIAERYLYMPSAAFCVGLPLFFGLQPHSQNMGKVVAFIACSVLLTFGTSTMFRTYVWSDPVTFLEDTVQKSPNFIPAYSDLAALYNAKGEHEKAMEMYSWAAVQVGEKEFVAVDVKRAHLLSDEGKFDEAREILLKRLENPGKSYRLVAETLILINLKYIPNVENDNFIDELKQENVTLLEKITENSGEPFLRYRLGKAYLALGDSDKAYESFDYAYKHAPEDSLYKKAARILTEKTRGKSP